MMKKHCDVCRQEMPRDRGHIWANTLPEGDPLRAVSATITFHGANRHNREAESDICDDCFTKWLRGIRGVLDRESVKS